MQLSLADAQRAIEHAQARATELGLHVTVAVVDAGGLLIALERMDGAPPISPQIAEAKAVGAAMFLRDGGWFLQTYQDRPGFFNAADRLTRVPLLPGPGSALLKRGDEVVGAIGISGARPEQDLECAEAGAASL
ncbi:MAG TPA: heme-binding protein [Candidatus Dormibacteraeota bacterium]|nr:heme-binding protein [Candidatus Dormibacteraeota bacterium]